jgi:secreted PhoX family phosphatase
VFGLRVGLGTNYGQGREFGFAQWIPLPHADNPNLETEGLAAGLTGYFRPEDADLDPLALAKGDVRLCSPDTGDESNHLYGQVVCITDGTIEEAKANVGKTEIQPFVFGGTSRGINMPDNIAFQPGRGNAILHEDAETTFETPHNNDLWDCLPDGSDQDLLSDGCARVGTLNDLTSEWTGGIFDATGKHFYVSVQHNISGQATILDITGWR